MKQANYVQGLQRHLTAYKSSRLGVDTPGTYRHKGEDLLYGHILPPELRWLNIAEPFRAEVRRYVEARPMLKLHKFFHHLNSSQAFALNLFFPFFESGESAALIRALGMGGSVVDWEPEYIADSLEGTNVDLSWISSNGARTFCEVKLSEQEFGPAADDERHQRKLAEIYAPVLRGLCADRWLEPPHFFASYQILRNIWLAARDPTASVLFLLPRANLGLWPALESVLTDLSDDLKTRVHTCAIEDVLSTLADDDGLSPPLAVHVQALQEKYVPSI